MTTETMSREQISAMLEQERATLATLLAGVSDTEWNSLLRNDGWTLHDVVGHAADSIVAMTNIATHGLPPGAGQMDRDALNAMMRQQNVGVERAVIEQRLADGFAAAQAALDSTPDLEAPGPFGPNPTIGQWFAGLVFHTLGHRQELEQIVATRA